MVPSTKQQEKSGGGVVIRDHSGKLIAAFATPLDANSALEAELLAAHFGLNIARELGQPMWIEMDASQAVTLIKGTSWGPVHIRRAMALLAIHKRQTNIRASFIHREGNKAADYLAKMGLEKDTLHRMNARTAPRLLKAIIRMEEMGVPNIRTRDDDHG